ncbi:MAG: HD domain-containing phosphohydrolase [Solirubrobacteraceae bacterium]
MSVAGWCVLTLALIPAFLYLVPASQWGDPLLLMTLYVLAVLADRSEVPLPSGVRFDATIALMLICVSLAGPLPALGVYLAPALANSLAKRERFLRVGTLGNFASTGWQAVLAAVVLELAAHAGGPAEGLGLLAAGAVLFYVGWAIAPAVWGTVWLDVPWRGMVEALQNMRLAAGVMVVLGAVTVVAFPTLDLLALMLFAVVAVLPQSALTHAARTRPVVLLDPLTATRRYAGAMAMHLGLGRAERRELDAVVRLAHARDVSGDPGEHLSHTVVDPSEVSCAAGHVTEWWNGAGGPAGVPGRIIPRSARIAAVARTWAALTAQGSPRLGHHEALTHLEGAAGVRLDPHVVLAARAVVGQERLSPAVQAPEPRLHHLRVPARLRRVLAAAP